MNRLARTLANFVRSKVEDSTKGRDSTNIESRFIFHGPPIDILERVYDELTHRGHDTELDKLLTALPVLLQYPATQSLGPNPIIGTSGKCNESHLLHIRNDPNCPSFVALVPPGQHNNRSVASTTDEFGINVSINTGHTAFEEWWEDNFIQWVVTKGLQDLGLANDALNDARQLIRGASMSVDEVDEEEGSRKAAWRLLSRVYSIVDDPKGLSSLQALALACGVPPIEGNGISSQQQFTVLRQIAGGMSDGFKTGVERLQLSATSDVKQALCEFLSHIQASCGVPTAFERATEAFYLPADIPELRPPPSWWRVLTVECWADLLAEEPDEAENNLSIECTNAVIPASRGMPAVVWDDVVLSISTAPEAVGNIVEAQLTGGSQGKAPLLIQIDGSTPHHDQFPPAHKSPIIYRVAVAGQKAITARVISLSSWAPGVLVTCRLATKLAPPKKPRKSSATADWESSFSLPGSGRYELLVLASPGTTISKAIGMLDDATDVDEGHKDLSIQAIKADEYQVEIEADGRYQLDIIFLASGRTTAETCRVYITCDETREEGCRSEFERLIKLNRRHLERFDAKAVIQLDRHARSSSLQSWILDEQCVAKSFRPLVMADDYATRWAPPAWDAPNGPILSHGKFLYDPRPEPARFIPPPGFVDARQKIAEHIRSTDEQSGLVESAPLGAWLSRKPDFRALVETYLDAYTSWISTDRDIACWVDTTVVFSLESDGLTLARVPDAVILSPLHPLRLAWHCLAQQVLYDEVEGDGSLPCPSASILDPDCVPDLLTLSLQTPGGMDKVAFLSVECNSDYWSVLWNGARLGQLAERCQRAPFDSTFGLTIGGISGGFSPAQVARALEDVSDLLAAKPIISLTVSSAGGATDACNDGLVSWCTGRFGNSDKAAQRQGVGPRILEIFDTRPATSRPDQAVVANLSEETGNHVRWFDKQPTGAKPDLGIIAQLDSAQPEASEVGMNSPLGIGALIRHRVRRQLNGAFLSESRQGLQMPPTGYIFADKVSACMVAMESGHDGKVGLQFAPNVHAISRMLEEHKAGFVAVSSTAIDPACFLGGWINGAYLWDYDLPPYSHRAGDTSGYYLLSQVKEADCEALKRVLELLPDCKDLSDTQVQQILLEVARRGIPTVRGLSGDDTGATGDLGLFLAVRLLQDQFRLSGCMESLLPVLAGSPDDASVAIIIPVDPFRGYLADLTRSLGKERKETSLLRPDLLVVGINITEGNVRLHLTPIEVKCRQGNVFSTADAKDALSQAKALSSLFQSIQERGTKSLAWRLAFQHLLLSMVGFGLRVYSQHNAATGQAGRWASYHQRIAAEILSMAPSISIDERGRLVIIDTSIQSGPHDHDGDGYAETIVISTTDAGRMIVGDAAAFYVAVRAMVGDWQLLPPRPKTVSSIVLREATPRILDLKGETSFPVEAGPITATLTDVSPKDISGAATVSQPNPSQPTSHLSQLDQETSSGVTLSIGRSVDGFEPRALSLSISDTRLNNLNIGVVGDLGTGKTQLLKSLIFQIAVARKENRGVKPRFLIFDYKRDYSSPEFVAATGARVVKPTRLPLNLFDTTPMGESAAPWLDRFRFFTDVLDKVYSGIGPVQRDKLKGAVRNAYESTRALGRQPTIYDIHAEYREILGDKSDSPMAIIDDLVDMEIFERDPEKTQPFNEFLDGVVVISLDALGQDDRSKNMLVAIMLNMFYENMLRAPKRPFKGTNPQLRVVDSYLLVDEADNIMRYEFDVLRKLLQEGREFGTGVILASQYLRHFKAGASDYRNPLLTWFIHKVPNVTPAELGALGLTADIGELSERVKTLPNHHCLYKSFNVTGEVIRGTPFYELSFPAKLGGST